MSIKPVYFSSFLDGKETEATIRARIVCLTKRVQIQITVVSNASEIPILRKLVAADYWNP